MTGRRRTPEGFWAVWTAVAMDLLGFGIIIPLLPLYADSFGASPATIGALVACYSLAQFVLAPVWGRLSDRLGRRPVLLATIAGSAIGSLVLGLAGGVAILFVGRIIDGASGASVAVARATIADVSDRADRPRLMGLLGAAFGVGFIAGPAIGGLAALGSPSLPFFVAAGISAINFAVGWARIPETRTARRTTRAADGAAAARSDVRRLLALTFVTVVALSAFEATFALLGERRFSMTPTAVAFAFAGVGVVLVATQAGLAGPLGRRFGEIGSIRIGIASSVLGFVVLAETGRFGLMLVGLGVLAFGQGLLVPMVSSAIAGAAGPHGSGMALGAHTAASGLARVVGPLLGGALFGIATHLPYRMSAALVAAALLLIPKVAKARETSMRGGP
jgi:MFS transporter, DHA1 family, tetracycline resistance protein